MDQFTNVLNTKLGNHPASIWVRHQHFSLLKNSHNIGLANMLSALLKVILLNGLQILKRRLRQTQLHLTETQRLPGFSQRHSVALTHIGQPPSHRLDEFQLLGGLLKILKPLNNRNSSATTSQQD